MAKANGRNPDGTFTTGNPGGPGRPKRHTETAYVLALSEAVSLEDWQAITQKAVAQAKAGDSQARAWLTKHLMGEQTLSQAMLIKATGVDTLNELLLLMMGEMIKRDAIDLNLMQKLADTAKERRAGHELTDTDNLLEGFLVDEIAQELEL